MRKARRARPPVRLMGVGVLALLVPLALGLWLDGQLATTPLLALAGALVGIVVATAGVVRIAGRAIDGLGRPSGAESGSGGRQEED